MTVENTISLDVMHALRQLGISTARATEFLAVDTVREQGTSNSPYANMDSNHHSADTEN
jgi:hypothetical protein